jgi:hypothetical protein
MFSKLFLILLESTVLTTEHNTMDSNKVPDQITAEQWCENCELIENPIKQQLELVQEARQYLPEDDLVAALDRAISWHRDGRLVEMIDGYIDTIPEQLTAWDKLLQDSYQGWSIWGVGGGVITSEAKPPPLLPRDVVQSIMEMLQPAEIASCMMVCKAWMEDGMVATRAWRGKMLTIYELISPFANSIFTEPWSAIALRYVEGVRVVQAIPNRNNLMTVDASPALKALAAAFSQQELFNIKAVELERISWMLTCDLLYQLKHQRQLQSVAFTTSPNVRHDRTTALSITSTMLEMCSLRSQKQLETFCIEDYEPHNDYLFKAMIDKLRGNRTLKSLVLPINSRCFNILTNINISWFVDYFIPNLLRMPEEERPPLKQLEFRIVGDLDVFTVVIKILKIYVRLGNIGSLELIRIVHPPLGRTISSEDTSQTESLELMEFKKTMFKKAFESVLLSGSFSPESRLHVEILLSKNQYSTKKTICCMNGSIAMLPVEMRATVAERITIVSY